MTNKKKTEISVIITRIMIYAFFAFILVLTIFPLWVLLVNATRSTKEIQAAFSLIPSTHLIGNWNYLIEHDLRPLTAFKNSALTAGGSTIVSVYSSMMMAYSLTVYQYKLKGLFFGFLMAIIMIPGQVSVIGYYQLMLDLKLTNNLWCMILPSVSSAGMVYFMMSYLKGALQITMIEAGRIDGASEFRIFQQLVFPLAKPAIGVQAIFAFVGGWNELYTSSLLLTNAKTRTLTLLLVLVDQSNFNKELGSKYLCIAFSIVPMLIVFITFSNYIVEGLALGSVKG